MQNCSSFKAPFLFSQAAFLTLSSSVPDLEVREKRSTSINLARAYLTK